MKTLKSYNPNRIDKVPLMSSNTHVQIEGYDEKEKMFLVKSPPGNIVKVQDTFAEMFALWAGRVLITAQNEKWAQIAASLTTGFCHKRNCCFSRSSQSNAQFQQTKHPTNDLVFSFKFTTATDLNSNTNLWNVSANAP